MSGKVLQIEDYQHLRKRHTSGDINAQNEDAEVITLPSAHFSVNEMKEFLNDIIKSCHPGEHDNILATEN